MIVGFSLLLAIMEVVRAQMEEMPGAGIGSGHKLRFSALLIFLIFQNFWNLLVIISDHNGNLKTLQGSIS